MTPAFVAAPSQPLALPRRNLGAWLLALGALLGVVSGVYTARQATPNSTALPPGVAALVDGRPILAGDYARALALLAGDRRTPLTSAERAHVLERLIDEELLVASALARGFLSSERPVRDAVTLAMVESVVADSASRAASEAELRASFADAQAAAKAGASELPIATTRDGLEALVAQRARNAALDAYLAELRGRARLGCGGSGAAP